MKFAPVEGARRPIFSGAECREKPLCSEAELRCGTGLSSPKLHRSYLPSQYVAFTWNTFVAFPSRIIERAPPKSKLPFAS